MFSDLLKTEHCSQQDECVLFGVLSPGTIDGWRAVYFAYGIFICCPHFKHRILIRYVYVYVYYTFIILYVLHIPFCQSHLHPVLSGLPSWVVVDESTKFGMRKIKSETWQDGWANGSWSWTNPLAEGNEGFLIGTFGFAVLEHGTSPDPFLGVCVSLFLTSPLFPTIPQVSVTVVREMKRGRLQRKPSFCSL